MSELIFSEKEKITKERKGVWKILVVDDEPSVHIITKRTFMTTDYLGKGIEIVSAHSWKEAEEFMAANSDIAVILMDVVMESEEAGLKAIKYIREVLNNRDVRIIIRTGQPGYAPEREVILGYDINDYKEKTELTSQKLFSSVISAIRSYNDIINLRQLSNELKEAKEKAESESRAKTLFLGNISHEIRTPMNGIISNMNLLQMMLEEQADFVENLKDMEESANNLIYIIDNLITVATLESGKIEPEIKEFKFYSFFKSVVETYEVTAKAKNIEFKYEIDNNIPDNLKGDAGIIKRILLSILSNAFKYTESGKILVKVSKVFQQNEDIRVEFSISDTGIGMEQDKIDMIFEPFNQGDLTASKIYQGMGLGLSIAKRIIELMGGEIVVKSKKEIGTTFTFYINIKAV